ncbi:MAG: PrsW family intramembrane metalloprotease [Oscillospiraceae bacterium]
MEKIKLWKLYSGVLKKHTEEDAENLIISGTPRTTPNIEDIPPELPKPWLFARVLLLSLAAFAGFYIGMLYFENMNFLPGLIMFGSVVTPISLLVFFWEINIVQNISVYKLTLFFVKGSVVSLLCTVILYAVLDGELSPILVGFIEETAKVLTIIILMGRKNYKYMLNGMLIGAAVGTGFAVFESAAYILMTAKYGIPTMLNTIFWRAVFAPGGHIAWASLTGTALIWVKGDRPLHISLLFDKRFLGMYILVVLMHTMWDTEIPHPLVLGVPVLPVSLTIISWVILFAVIKRGFRQVINIAQDTQTE